MKVRDEDYELGRDVTHLALASGTKRDMAVLSVRLPASEIARLERIGHENGKTLSQVVRDAVSVYRTQKPTTAVVLGNGVAVRIGKPDGVSVNAPRKTVCPDTRAFSTGAAKSVMVWGNHA